MAITVQNFTQMVQNVVAAIQGAATTLIDLSIGSVLLAATEANSAIGMWLQAEAIQVAALTRFATSNGTDADTWGADFDYTRLPAQAASGSVTFSRFTPTIQAIIAVGSIVQTSDATQQFAVIADTTQPSYNASLNAYVIPIGVSGVTATVQCLTVGSAGNVQAGLLNTLGTSIAGVDTVSNPVAFDNGDDAESDPAFKLRFVSFILSLSKATVAAIGNAVQSIQQDVSYVIVENTTYAGVPLPGYFFVVADNGTGNPPSSFLSAVFNAVDAVRPIGSTFGVFAPTLQSASASLAIATAPGYSHSTLVALVITAITNYINSLQIGESLPYTRLAQLAYDASPGITNVSSVVLNGSNVDLNSTSVGIIKAGSIAVV